MRGGSAVGKVYSFSRISTFEQCARRFRYRYIDGVKEAFESVESFMGRCVHETIEWLFVERDRGKTHDEAAAVARYCDIWDRAVRSSARIIKVVRAGADAESYRRTGAELVARFHRERFTGDRLTTIANEMHFRIEIGAAYSFQGYIDRLARDDRGRLHVIDYKTGRRAPASFGGKQAEQLEAYALGVFRQHEAPALELVLDFLRPGRVLRRTVHREAAAEIEASLVSRIRAVEEATVFPPNPGALCDWCGYNDICEAAGGRRRVVTAW